MVIRKTRSVRSLIAAAGLLTSLYAVLPAHAQQSGGAASIAADAGVQATLDAAADMLREGRVVEARASLVGLTTGSGSISAEQQKRLVHLMTNASQRLKTLDPIDVSLQTAVLCLKTDDLRTLDRHAGAVVNAPKATNAQATQARELLAKAQARREVLAGAVDPTLAAATDAFARGDFAAAKTGVDQIYRAGLPLTAAQDTAITSLQARIIEVEEQRGRVYSTTAAAGMMQPGVVKRRENAPANQPANEPANQPAGEPAPQPAEPPAAEQPATPPAAEPAPQPASPQPAAEPTPAQPGSQDLIQQARRFEAQNLLAEANIAFEEVRMNEAERKYNRLLEQYRAELTPEQASTAEQRRAEARIRLGGQPGGNDLLREFGERNQLAKQQVVAEFNNDMAQAQAALTRGDTRSARDLAATANLKLNNARNLFSEPEFQDYSRRVTELQGQIERRALEIAEQTAQQREQQLINATTEAARAAQQDKSRKISEAIDRVRALQKELKYSEALQVVNQQILFLDPINPTGLLLRDVLEDVIIYEQFGRNQRRKPQGIVFNELQNEEAMIPPTGLMEYPSDWPRISYQRGEPIAFAETEENRRVLAMLESKRIPVEFNDTPMANIVGFLQAVTQVNIDVDWGSLELAGINRDTPVTMNLTNVTVRTVLDRVVDKVSPDLLSGAAWAVQDGVILIASREVINKNKRLEIYDIRDLLIEVPDYDNAPDFDLQSVLQQGEGGGGGQSPFQENEEEPERRTLEERTQDILDIITTNVDQQGWQENGGDTGYIQQLGGNLIITNTPANHRAIHGLLTKLREVRSMQINVETRFLLVSQDYFEQIGFDIDVYFNGDNNQVRAARAANPGAGIQPSDFFDFSQGGLQRRVSPPPFDIDGDGTPDPQPTQPVVAPSPWSPIGAGQNSLGLTESLAGGDFANSILGAAPALGVAGQFLDDIQVDFLIKATQADRRTVSLTAPRLTFTNGQTANIYVATQVAFVSDLNPVVSESAVGFDPDLGVVNEGVRLLVEGTVSADRRYVTMNVDAAVARIEGFANTPVTAIAGGQLVNSAATQSFIQRPTTTVTRVQTTVTVPDQGTILLGGQRLVTEREIETGVPVLSKIPVLNRFFTNRIETKEEQTLLILIKPTILIQNEEEEKNFPGLAESIRAPFAG